MPSGVLLAFLVLTQTPADPACGDEAVLLNQDLQTFDQDPHKGWRALAARPQCRAKAAELMQIFREMLQMRLRALVWHEGQVRAQLGQTAEAIRLFEEAKHPSVVLGQSQESWNAYADATIAFLKQDRPALLAARSRLAAAPVPRLMMKQPDGSLRPVTPANWPPNLDVVDGLITCFGRPYAEAYGANTCRKARVQPVDGGTAGEAAPQKGEGMIAPGRSAGASASP